MLALLRYWPTGNTGKEILFLNELEDLFEPLEPIHVRGYVKPLMIDARISSNSDTPRWLCVS